MNNNMVPWGISKKAWQGKGSRKKLLCQMENRLPGNYFYTKSEMWVPPAKVRGTLIARISIARCIVLAVMESSP